ncbi:NVEALA domain-containing protein [Parabacteroides faecis]|uniref:NVEALA domain-containing protein n=1 Tax=Parabacteroides faecis TaxID=1217282 RepID=UPI003520A4F7
MKKKFFGVALIAAMVVTAGWNFNQSKNEMEISDLALANIEALARNENSDINCSMFPDTWCSFVVSTPGGNWIEEHYNMLLFPF